MRIVLSNHDVNLAQILQKILMLTAVICGTAFNIAAAGEVTIENHTKFDLELTVWEVPQQFGYPAGIVKANSTKTFRGVDQSGEVILEVCPEQGVWCGPGGTLQKRTRLPENGKVHWTVSRAHDRWNG